MVLSARKYLRFYAAIVLLHWPAMGYTSSPLQPMTFAQAWNAVKIENDALQASRAEVEQAEHKQDAAKDLYLPEVTLGAKYTRLDDAVELSPSDVLDSMPDGDKIETVLNNIGQSVGISPGQVNNGLTSTLAKQNNVTSNLAATWPIYTGGRIIAAQNIAAGKVNEAKYNLKLQVLSQFENLVRYYFGAVLAKQVYETRINVETGLRKHRDNAVLLEKQGQIEAQQYNIGSKVPGRIDEVCVRKGDKVKVGQLIFSLHSPEIDAKLAQAQAGHDAAQALAEEVNIGARVQQIKAARDQWMQAKAAEDLLLKTYQRINNPYKDGVVAEQQRDEIHTKLLAARYTSSAALQMYKLAEEGARDETKKAAEDKARMAAGAVAEVEVYAADTTIKSWHDGEVTQVLLRSGELAPQGFPVVTIIDMNDAYAVFHVREDHLFEFPQGSEFDATIPALGDKKYRFKVSYIAAMGDFATWRATNVDTGVAMRTFEIEARPVHKAEGLRAGMSVLIVR